MSIKKVQHLDNLQMSLDGLNHRQEKCITLNKQKMLKFLKEMLDTNNLKIIKFKVQNVLKIIAYGIKDNEFSQDIYRNSDITELNKEVLVSVMKKILKAHTLQRAHYYIKWLIKSIEEVKTNNDNDINLTRWREYDNIITDSLWIFDRRDTSGAHKGWYWGNFIPQIPNQVLLRYTKKGDWVLDTFLGSGTTLIECRRLGRNGIGIELNPEIAQKAREAIETENNLYGVITDIVVEDSRRVDLNDIKKKYGINSFKLVIMHPPYHDIIKFSDLPEDLSNAKNVNEFLRMFEEVVKNVTPHLSENGYLVLVIGDKYSKGEWIPLGFYCMQIVLQNPYILKSIVVKNFEETKGKRNQKELWRYRALVGGFYVFKHEYIMIFKKRYRKRKI